MNEQRNYFREGLLESLAMRGVTIQEVGEFAEKSAAAFEKEAGGSLATVLGLDAISDLASAGAQTMENAYTVGKDVVDVVYNKIPAATLLGAGGLGIGGGYLFHKITQPDYEDKIEEVKNQALINEMKVQRAHIANRRRRRKKRFGVNK